MWRPGTLVFLTAGGLRLLRPNVENRRDGMTCTVLGSEELEFGTKGPTYRHVLLGECQIYTADVNNVTARYFDPIEET